MYVFIRHIFCDSLVKICVIKQMPLIFVIFFPDIGFFYVFDLPKQKVYKIKNSATLRLSRVIYGTFSKYFKPLDKLA